VGRDRHRLTALPRWLVPALAAAPVLVLLVLYALPLATLLATVVDGDAVADALGDGSLARALWFTLWQASLSTVVTMLLGFAPAYLLARHRFRGRRAVLAVVTVPFMLPTVVVGAAFLALLPHRWHASAGAVVLAHVFFNIAVVVRLVGAAWAVLPTDLTAAARTLGAGEAQVLRHVVLPLLRPALWAAASVVFVFCFTSFGVVRLLGGPRHRTLEVEIVERATRFGSVGQAAVLAVLQLVLLAGVVWWSARWQRRAAATFGRGATERTARTPRQRALLRSGVWATLLLMLAPVSVLVLRSFRVGDRWSLAAWRTLGTEQVRPGVGLGVDPLGSLWVSLRYAAVATAISVVVGAAAALTVAAAGRRGRFLDAGLMLPLGTSAVTVGLGMLITFDHDPFDWRAEWWLVPLGHALVALPFVVRTVVPHLRAIATDQRAAAMVLGATPLRAWWEAEARRVARPLAAGAGFAAAVSLGEFGATSLLTRAGSDSLPVAIDHLLGRAGDVPRAQGFALAVVLLALTAGVVLATDRMGGSNARRA
jgi:thiamine transport system permease protein